MKKFEPYTIGPKPWGEEKVIAHTDQYLGKVLTMHAGHRGGLQYHEKKDETFHLFSGIAQVRGHDEVWHIMRPGESYYIAPGTIHQVEAVTDCVFFECSTPVFDDRVNVGDPAA